MSNPNDLNNIHSPLCRCFGGQGIRQLQNGPIIISRMVADINYIGCYMAGAGKDRSDVMMGNFLLQMKKLSDIAEREEMAGNRLISGILNEGLECIWEKIFREILLNDVDGLPVCYQDFKEYQAMMKQREKPNEDR